MSTDLDQTIGTATTALTELPLSIKSILYACNGDTSEGSSLHYALLLAKHHDAWLTGALRHGQSDLERTLRGRVPKKYLASFFQSEKLRFQAVEERFREFTANTGFSDRCDFVDLDTTKDISLSEFARTFDVVVTGIHSNRENEEHMSANADLIALRSGRPCTRRPSRRS